MSLLLRHLWLTDFRSYRETEVALASGTTAIVGANGAGKTNVLEAVAHLSATSLRGATNEAMVRLGAERAILRAEATRGARELLIEGELPIRGRGRMQLNRQAVRRRSDLLAAMAVTIFSPEDLVLVKGGPGERRRWLDDALCGLDPAADQLRGDLERIVRQRNALLKGVKGRLDESARLTLDVWDDRLHRAGTALAGRREQTLAELGPAISVAYGDLAGRTVEVSVTYRASWAGRSLAEALAEARDEDVRRGVTTVGPHRDEVALAIDGRAARTHASQGEQRSLALALRLAVHRAMTDTHGVSPILLLDDVLSELDDGRGAGLLTHLPAGQTLLTSATELPPATSADLILDVVDGELRPR